MKHNGDFALGGMSYKNFLEKIDNSYEAIVIGSERIKKIIDNLSNYSKKPKIQYKKISLNEVVEVAINITNNFIQKSTNNFICKIFQRISFGLGKCQSFGTSSNKLN